jgi:hypothetical protein
VLFKHFFFSFFFVGAISGYAWLMFCSFVATTVLVFPSLYFIIGFFFFSSFFGWGEGLVALSCLSLQLSMGVNFFSFAFLLWFFPFSFYPVLLINFKKLAVSGKCYLSLFYFY